VLLIGIHRLLGHLRCSPVLMRSLQAAFGMPCAWGAQGDPHTRRCAALFPGLRLLAPPQGWTGQLAGRGPVVRMLHALQVRLPTAREPFRLGVGSEACRAGGAHKLLMLLLVGSAVSDPTNQPTVAYACQSLCVELGSRNDRGLVGAYVGHQMQP
jgi:hypothetical protein